MIDKKWICYDCFYRNDIKKEPKVRFSRVDGMCYTEGEEEVIGVRCESANVVIWDKIDGGIIIDKCLMYKPDAVYNSG